MKKENLKNFAKSKWFAVVMLIVGSWCLLIIGHSIFSYDFIIRPDVENLVNQRMTGNPVGGWNNLAYFTVLSNLIVGVWLVIRGWGRLFGNKKIISFAENPTVVSAVTAYIFVTGFTYSFLMIWFVSFYPWEGVWAFQNIICISHHMLVPLFCTILFFFPTQHQYMDKNKTPLRILAFPICYLIFTELKGATLLPVWTSNEPWYPYPFLNPYQVWKYLGGGKPFNAAASWTAVVIAIILFVLFFYGLAKFECYTYNKDAKKNGCEIVEVEK